MKLILDNGASFVVSDEALIVKYYNEIVGEQWRPVVGYEGLYEVSSYGNVYSMRTKKILKPRDNGRGYLRVNLYKNGKQKNCRVHRLVAEAFIPNPENKPTLNHINEIKTDNRVCNLEWMTHKENTQYSLAKRVLCIETGDIYDSIKEATEKTGVNPKNIGQCCNGRRKTAGGFHWCFV